MIYNRKTVQGNFVSGLYTPILLFTVSVVVWLVCTFLPLNRECTIYPCAIDPVGYYALSFVSLLFVLLASLILNGINIFERRVRWLPALSMWLAAISFLLCSNFMLALGMLLFVLSFFIIMSPRQYASVERLIYSVFALVALSSLLLPQFIFFLPLYIIYLSISNMLGIRGMLASLLGLATPYWLAFGLAYVYPAANVLLLPFYSGVAELFVVPSFHFGHLQAMLCLCEVPVLLPAIFLFATTSVPAKPVLRRRLLLFIIANICFLLLSSVEGNLGSLACACSVPGVAVMAAYIFSFKITRLSNIYFIIIAFIWVLSFVYSLWTELY